MCEEGFRRSLNWLINLEISTSAFSVMYVAAYRKKKRSFLLYLAPFLSDYCQPPFNRGILRYGLRHAIKMCSREAIELSSTGEKKFPEIRRGRNALSSCNA